MTVNIKWIRASFILFFLFCSVESVSIPFTEAPVTKTMYHQ